MKQPTDLSKRNDALYEAWLYARHLTYCLHAAHFTPAGVTTDCLSAAWQALQAKMEAVLP